MKLEKLVLIMGFVTGLMSCVFVVEDKEKALRDSLAAVDSLNAHSPLDSMKAPDSFVVVIDTVRKDSMMLPTSTINTKQVQPQQLVEFSKTLIGVPYKYASTDPAQGFDCSGFITYVFKHFDIIVPRSSIDFTHVGKTIPTEATKPGDIILFTGTDSTEKFVGHMGIIVSNNNGVLEFIHSTSGKKYGVTITPLNDYYKSRFVKTIRIFPQNDR